MIRRPCLPSTLLSQSGERCEISSQGQSELVANNGFQSSFYPIVEALYKGKPLETLFTTRNEQYHSQLLRGAANAYSMKSLTDLETQVQPVIDLFLNKLEEFGARGTKPVDAGNWVQYFTFDALGAINFSTQFGFLQTGTDVGDNMKTIDGLIAYLSIIGQAPWLHKVLLGNPVVQKILPLENYNEIQNFAIRMIERRTRGEQPDAGYDLLARLLEVAASEPTEKEGEAKTKQPPLTHAQIIALTTTNILAGSATTACGLRSIFYHLCRNPSALKKLQTEVDEAFSSGALSTPSPRYAEAAKLPYLDAVVVEGLRMHPATGFVLEREVPAGGAVICGEKIPEGTVVGINAWVMHANKQVFGEDAETFRPERWLEDGEERIKVMKRCNMTVRLSLSPFFFFFTDGNEANDFSSSAPAPALASDATSP